MSRYVEEIKEEHMERENAPEIDFAKVESALSKLREAGEQYERALEQLTSASSSTVHGQPELARLNQLLYTSERRLSHDEGCRTASGSATRSTRPASTPATGSRRYRASGKASKKKPGRRPDTT